MTYFTTLLRKLKKKLTCNNQVMDENFSWWEMHRPPPPPPLPPPPTMQEKEEQVRRRLRLLHNGVIVTLDGDDRVFDDGAILFEGDVVKKIDKSFVLLRDYSYYADEVIDLQHRIVLPGLFSSPHHADEFNVISTQIQILRSSILSRVGEDDSHISINALRMLGFAPIKKKIGDYISFSLGTVGTSSADEMFVSALINKGSETCIKGTTAPTTLPTEAIIKNDAKSVLGDDGICSFEVGKKADLVTVNPFAWPIVRQHDWFSEERACSIWLTLWSLVYCARTEDIESVMCSGQWIMYRQKIMNTNEASTLLTAKGASFGFLKKGGTRIPNRMNIIHGFF